MKKGIKIIITIGIIILAIIELDTIQALVFNQSPLLHKREYTCKQETEHYIDYGIFVNHYNCSNTKGKTLFKNKKSDCVVCFHFL